MTVSVFEKIVRTRSLVNDPAYVVAIYDRCILESQKHWAVPSLRMSKNTRGFSCRRLQRLALVVVRLTLR